MSSLILPPLKLHSLHLVQKGAPEPTLPCGAEFCFVKLRRSGFLLLLLSICFSLKPCVYFNTHKEILKMQYKDYNIESRISSLWHGMQPSSKKQTIFLFAEKQMEYFDDNERMLNTHQINLPLPSIQKVKFDHNLVYWLCFTSKIFNSQAASHLQKLLYQRQSKSKQTNKV